MAGNANSGPKKEKPFSDALRMEIAAAGDDRKDLRQIARVLLSKAKSGDMQAIMCLFDRLEGKALQQIEAHNINEHVFAEVPETMPKEQWDSLHVPQSGKPKAARNGH